METIYTIPIHEAYERKCGCPLCKLEADLEQISLEYVMGAAMMEPDVRIETNRYGFCAKHFRDMLGMQKKLPLALILESHTQELLSAITQDAPGKKEFPALADKFSTAIEDCYVCRQIKDRLNKYYSNVIHLWLVEPEFKVLTRQQEYFCPHHLAGLLSFAKEELNKKYFAEFYKDHTFKTAELLKKISGNVSKFAKSFDHRFANEPLGDAKSAVEDAIDFLSK